METPKIELVHYYKASLDFIQDNTGIFTRGYLFKQMEGQLLTIVEAMGLSEKQENAIKSYVRQAIWGTLDGGSVFILSSEAEDLIFADLNKTMVATPSLVEKR